MVYKAATVEEYSSAQDINTVLAVAKKTDEMLQEIISHIKPGMKESEALTKAREIYESYGVVRSWHNPYIRFGTNTTLTYLDKPSEDIRLAEEDIAFIDIGPIFDEIEGDAGQTLVFGDNPLFHDLKARSEEIFERANKFFQETNPTGNKMYEYLCQTAEGFGYEFNLETAGHLIGQFSHSGCGASDGMKNYTEPMKPGVWIIEVQIRDKEKPYGAFFEKIML